MEFTGPIILGVAILAVVAFVGYQLLSRRTEEHQQNSIENENLHSGQTAGYPPLSRRDENLRPTKNDRELLSLIRDLAEMYRATGR